MQPTPEWQALRQSVKEAYSSAAANPAAPHPFPVGAAFAHSLNYPPEILETIPPAALDGFAGVSNVATFADLPATATVLDLGCGAGLDSLIAAQRLHPRGRVLGIDFSDTMLARAHTSARQLGLENLHFLQSAAEQLPLPGASIDCALVNGIFNLNPCRQQIFNELARVLKPGARVFGAELILRAPLPESARTGAANWFS